MEYKLIGLAVAFAFFDGSRHERMAALALTLHALFHLPIALVPDGLAATLAYVAGHAVLALAFVWMAVRYPARWLIALAVVQAMEATAIAACLGHMDFYIRHIRPWAFAIGLLKPMILSLAVANRLFGAPQRPPALTSRSPAGA